MVLSGGKMVLSNAQKQSRWRATRSHEIEQLRNENKELSGLIEELRRESARLTSWVHHMNSENAQLRGRIALLRGEMK